MRLFIALDIPEDTKAALADSIRQLRQHDWNVKWVRTENMHLTLRFLGETQASLVTSLTQLIETATLTERAIACQLAPLSVFPNARRPRVIWAGLTGETERLASVARALESGVRDLGFKPETKPFRPHLTIGRVRDGFHPEPDFAALLESVKVPPVAVRFDRVSLYESELTPRGPIYRMLAETPLS